jgi:Glutamine synthetase, catalytic domain
VGATPVFDVFVFDDNITTSPEIGGPDGDFQPAVSGSAYGMTRLIEQSAFSRDLLEALREQGIDVEQFHPEYAPGQFELSMAPQDPVGAADLMSSPARPSAPSPPSTTSGSPSRPLPSPARSATAATSTGASGRAAATCTRAGTARTA